MNQTQPTDDEYRQFYAGPPDPPDSDPYALNLAGLVAFNPTYPGLGKTLGPTVEVNEPIMLGGPEVSFSQASRSEEWHDHTSSSEAEAVVVKLDVSGQDRVASHGRDITDQQAAELLDITKDAFARGHQLAAAGLKQGVAAMDNPKRIPDLSAEAGSPHQVIEADRVLSRGAGGPNLGIGPPR